jgi:hypothetical protein
MLSHATTREWLIPYADGMLAADERRRIDGHITGCAACAAELREVRELNLLLVTLPPAPPVAVAPFWQKLQARLPQRRTLRIPTFAAYRRLGVAFAAAAVALVAVAGSAFAAPSALPDNPLYPVKQIEEHVRLTLTPANERLTVQLQLASERLREAQAMAANHKPRLAENSLRAFTLIVDDAAVSLKNPVNPQATKDALLALRAKLDDVERVNVNRNDDIAGIKQLVTAAGDELDRIEQQDSVTAPVVVVGEQATPEPTPQATPKPTPKPTPTDDGDRRDHQIDNSANSQTHR